MRVHNLFHRHRIQKMTPLRKVWLSDDQHLQFTKSLSPKGKGKEDEKGKGKGKGRRAGSRPRSGTPVPTGPVTRAAYIMPINRYPVAVEGGHMSYQSKHYSVVFDVLRAVQYGAVFSPAVNKAGDPRGNYVTSGIPANAIVQIKTGNGQVINPNTLGTAEWHSNGPSEVPDNMPTIKVTGRAEMPIVGNISCSAVACLQLKTVDGQGHFGMSKPSRKDISMNRLVKEVSGRPYHQLESHTLSSLE